jgi:hypothetical protein
VFLGPPGTGMTHLATGISIRACQAAGPRVQFATASQWTGRLAAAHAAGPLQAELARLARYPLVQQAVRQSAHACGDMCMVLPRWDRFGAAGGCPCRAGQKWVAIPNACRSWAMSWRS